MEANLYLLSTLFLSLGHPQQMPVQSADIWISDPKVVEAQVLGSKILLRPKEKGVAYVSGMGTKAAGPQRVQVLSYENHQALKRCPHSALQVSNEGLEVTNFEMANLQKLSDCAFEELHVSPKNLFKLQSLVEKAESTLLSQGKSFQMASWKNGQRHLLVSENQNVQRYLQSLGVLRPFYSFEKVKTVNPGRTLIFELVLFEFSTQRAQSLGLSWPQNLQIHALDGALSFLNSAGTQGFNIGADFGESEGVGRILARPQIRSIPGEKALFQSGGELPIKSSTLVQSQTTWKSYGLIVELEPSAEVQTGAGEISLKFKVELSEPDGATAIDGVPGMLMRKLESRFDLRTGETTILTTMIQSRQLKSLSGLPGLSRLPLLGAAFSKRNETQQDSELWFAIKPRWEGMP